MLEMLQEIYLENPKLSDNQEIKDWVAGVIDKIKMSHNNANNGTYNNLVLILDNFPVAAVTYYKALQEEIASIVPCEYKRPMIIVDVRGECKIEVPYHKIDKSNIGIIGGTGPVSDAAALCKLVETAKVSNPDLFKYFRAVVFSIPPPRLEWYADFFQHILRYKQALTTYVWKYPAKSYCLLSNTSHLYFDKLGFLLGRDQERLFNMVEINANDIAENSNLLILGTERAHDKLYAPLFEKRPTVYPIFPRTDWVADNVRVASCGDLSFTIPGNRAKKLQWLIDQTKSGHANLQITLQGDEEFPDQVTTIGDMFIDFVIEQMQRSDKKINSILLACTELSVLLDCQNEHGESYRDVLITRLKNECEHDIMLYNSEKMFVTIMSMQHAELVGVLQNDFRDPSIKSPAGRPDLTDRKREVWRNVVCAYQKKANSKINNISNVICDIGTFVSDYTPSSVSGFFEGLKQSVFSEGRLFQNASHQQQECDGLLQ